MRANIKFTAIYILVLVLLTLSLVAVISYSQDVTYAQNTDVQIDLSEDSLFDSYGEVFAYTYGYSLYLVVDNNIINLTSAFEGTAIDIAMNGSKILVLTSSALYEYSYTTSSITSNGAVTRFSGTIIGLFNDSYDGLGVIMNTNTATYMQDYSAQTTYVTWPLSDVYSDYLSVISSNVMFALKDGVLYRSPIEGIDASFTAISSLSNVYSITSDGTNIYALTESGVYKINALTLSTSFLGEIFSTSVKIKVVEIEESEYIFAFGNKSIVQYLINGSSLEYYNKFDNSSYVHPTSFDIVKVVMLNENVNVYSSPRNMQVTTTLSTGDLVLVLCEQASDVSSDVYYYIATTSGTLGYIKSTTSCTETDKTTDTTTLSIGLYAQGLHASTTIYAYPYVGADSLSTVTIYDKLVVIDNVAEIDGEQVWNFYKVSYVDDEDNIITGYVKTTDVSPYTALETPKVLKSVKVKSETIGEEVNVYVLPDENSTVIAYLTDGAEVDLAEEFNENSTWTKIVYNDTYAYILTENLQQGGLTTLQITLIVISCLVFAATVAIVSIILYRRRMGY